MSGDIKDFVKTAIHCSVFLAPTNPGLTSAELVEVGKRLGFAEGEIGDEIRQTRARGDVQDFFGNEYLLPTPNPLWCMFLSNEEPEFRNVAAFDFVITQLHELAKQHGRAQAQIERSVLVERGVQAGFSRRDMEATITVMLLGEYCTEDDSIIRRDPRRTSNQLASEQVNQIRDEAPRVRETKRRTYPVVADVIARRSDGRAAAAEPLDAFGEMLERLGYKPFRLWWTQTVAELRQLDPLTTPVATSVLSAGLIEGALTFLVSHARKLGLGPFKSKDFDGDPRTWKIDNLVRSAETGGASAVLDAGTRHRADEVIRIRQRIHAGRMLSEHPGGPPDLRPDEARDAKRTADVVVRRILDWLQKYPPV
jgi:hypothetical protein